MKNFESLMSDILEVETVEMTDEITAFDSWDSLTVLSMIATISDEYNVELTREEIENSITIEGLQTLINSKK